jgi:hypothetical protein
MAAVTFPTIGFMGDINVRSVKKKKRTLMRNNAVYINAKWGKYKFMHFKEQY